MFHRRKKKERPRSQWYLLALVADVIGISVHGEACGVVVETGARRSYCLALVQTFVFQPHQSLSPHVIVELFDRVQQVLNHRVIDFVLQTRKEMMQ